MKKERSNSFKTTINLLSSVGVLITNLCISFFLSPYIIRTIGVETNGFVNLANTFVTYADLVVTALNAMAARFITIAYVQKDYKKANLYYNSVFWGNLRQHRRTRKRKGPAGRFQPAGHIYAIPSALQPH